MKRIILLTALLALLAPRCMNAAAQPVGNQSNGACDRTCLEGWVDNYLVAMRENGTNKGGPIDALL